VMGYDADWAQVSMALYKLMVLVYDKPGTLLVFYRLNSAIERGTKPDA
jgi:hypothetical protein